MTAQQLIVVTVLWFIVVTLMALVFLMYAQIERAYRRSGERDGSGLEPGSKCPDLDLMSFEGLVPFEFPDVDVLHVMVFIQRGCDGCVQLLDDFANAAPPSTEVNIFQGDGGQDPAAETLPANVTWRGLGDPERTYIDYKINSFPIVFVCQGQTALAVEHMSTVRGIDDMVAHVRTHESLVGHQ